MIFFILILILNLQSPLCLVSRIPVDVAADSILMERAKA